MSEHCQDRRERSDEFADLKNICSFTGSTQSSKRFIFQSFAGFWYPEKKTFVFHQCQQHFIPSLPPPPIWVWFDLLIGYKNIIYYCHVYFQDENPCFPLKEVTGSILVLFQLFKYILKTYFSMFFSLCYVVSNVLKQSLRGGGRMQCRWLVFLPSEPPKHDVFKVRRVFYLFVTWVVLLNSKRFIEDP